MADYSEKKRILLHSCCGPCSTAVIERLVDEYDVTVYYFNPNITDPDEYEHRKSEQKRYIEEYSGKTGNSVDYIEGDYDPRAFFEAVKGFEQEKEGGARCAVCFELRLRSTAAFAKAQGFDCFDTTLSVSPHKDSKTIAEISRKLALEYGIEYLGGNYKKQDGFKRSTELAREYGLYRQNYCGCVFSDWRPAELK